MTVTSTQLRSTTRWLSIPLLVAFAACSSGSRSASHATMLTSSAVRSFEVVPGTASVPAGTKLPFAARASFVDGTSRDVSLDSAWSSSDPSLVSFLPGQAIAIATATGTTQVTATYQGISATASLTITPGLVLAMTVSPAAATVAKGTTQQLSVFAVLSDSKQDVTRVAAWKSSSATVAAVTDSGLVSALSAGTATITAEFGGAIVLARVTVTSATLQSITIGGPGSSGGISTVVGVDVPLTANGGFSDGNSQDLTTQVTWTSSDTSVATVSPDGVVHPVGPGTTVISADRDGVGSSVVVTVTQASLVALTLTPGSRTLAIGTTAGFQALGAFSDGTSRDLTSQVSWASSNDLVAAVAAGGTVTAKGAGTAVIAAASADGTVGATASVSVTTAQLVSIAVTPAASTLAAGLTQQLSATGTFSDGSTQPLTAAAGWTSSNATIAWVSNATATAGLVTATTPGTVTVTARFNGVAANATVTVSTAILRSIAVSGPASIAAGTSGIFKATGTYSDGSTQDVSSLAAWSSSSQAVFTVTSAGSATGIAAGTATVAATIGAVSGSAALTVTAATLRSLAVTPATRTLAAGATQPFAASATFSDGSAQAVSDQVTWTTSDGTVATISGTGLLTAHAKGSVTVTATLSGKSSSASVTVTDASVVDIAITPAQPSIYVGVATQLTATAYYTDGTSLDVTSVGSWSALGSATVAAGSVTGTAAGTVTIGFSYGGQSASVTSTVQSASLVLQVDPTTYTSPIDGPPVSFTATGTFVSNGTPVGSQDMTNQVTWSSSDPSVATVTAASDTQQGGLVAPVGVGTVTITASITVNSVSATATATFIVNRAVLTDLVISPPIAKIATGTQVAYQLTGFYSDYSSAVQTDVTWASSAPDVATVDADGVVSGVRAGTTTITAALNTCPPNPAPCYDTWTVQVADAATSSIAVALAPQDTLPIGLEFFLTANQTFTGADGSRWTQDVSRFATWMSGSFTVAQFSSLGTSPVVLDALAQGESIVTASYAGATGRTTVHVVDAALVGLKVVAGTTSGLVPVGYSVPLTAWATYGNGSTYEVTAYASWLSADPAAATVSNANDTKGVVTGIAPGFPTIWASFSGKSGSLALEVVYGTLDALTITRSADVSQFTPENQPAPIGTLGTIAVGDTVHLYAIGTFTDASSRVFFVEMTNQATWRASPRSIVWVTNSLTSAALKNGGTKGVVSGTSPGDAKIVARKGNVADSADVNVVSAQ